METYIYKGISAGKYIEGNIEALNTEEASHKLKEQKVIITNLTKTKKTKTKDAKKEKNHQNKPFSGSGERPLV